VFTCSVILLLITVLLLMWYLPLNAIVLVLLVEIVNPYFDIIFSSLCTDFCNKVSDSATIYARSPTTESILGSIRNFSECVFNFYSIFLHIFYNVFSRLMPPQFWGLFYLHFCKLALLLPYSIPLISVPTYHIYITVKIL
jgi:hypothetical protein